MRRARFGAEFTISNSTMIVSRSALRVFAALREFGSMQKKPSTCGSRGAQIYRLS
jgi:hypothetical protein